MIPIYKSFEIVEFDVIWIEKDKSKIKDTKICTNKRERKVFIHTLKNHSEVLVIKLKKAKGLIRTKIWIIMYLREYVNKRFINPKVVKDFIIPSKEKIFKISPEE